MIRYSVVMMFPLALSLTGCGGSGPALPTTTLQEAIGAGEADARFYGTGGSSGDSVMVDVSKNPNATPGSQTVTIAPGSRLESSEAGAQSMVVLRVTGRVTGANSYEPSSDILIPASGSATYALNAFCAEFHKDNPSASTHFTLRAPDPTLACIARQSVTVGLSIEAVQAAIWIYTDRLTYDETNQKFRVSFDNWSRAQQAVAACVVTPK